MSGKRTSGVQTGGAFRRIYRWALGIGLERNVGGVERTVRYTLGGLLVLVAVVIAVGSGFGTAGTVALAVVLLASGSYLIYEARVQYCPLNHTVGRSTYREKGE